MAKSDPMMKTGQTGEGPLHGLRVVDVSTRIYARMAAGYLALLGADVIRCDFAAPGDELTGARRLLTDLNKRVLSHPPLEVLRRVSATCDVFISDEDTPAELLDGVPADAVRLDMTGFGAAAADPRVKPTEVAVQALAGLAGITGEPDAEPLRVGPDAATQSAAIYGASGVVAALIGRARTQQGQTVEVSVQEAAINIARPHFSRSSESGEPARRPGNRQPAAQAEPTGAFPAAGGGSNDWVFLHGSSDHLWKRLLIAIGREDLLDDERFADEASRLANAAECRQIVIDWTSARGKMEGVDVLAKSKVPAGAAWTVGDLLASDDLIEAGVFADVVRSNGSTVRVPATPYRISDGGMPAPQVPAVLESLDESPWLSERNALDVPERWRGRPASAAAPLEGVLVADLTQALAGPAATQVLAFLGAEVIRIQRPGGEQLGVNRPWLVLNELSMNKKSAVFDLKDADDLDVVHRLIREADVVAENFAPHAMERLGLGPDVISELNPQTVFARVKGFPPGSRFESFLAFENIGEAMGGGCSLTGEPEGPPMLPGPFLADSGSGITSALGILAMLYRRMATGAGGAITTSMQGAVATVFSRLAYAVPLATGRTPSRNGFADVGRLRGPIDVYRCAGGDDNDYCVIDAAEDADWLALTELIGRPDLAADPGLADSVDRHAQRLRIRAAVEEWTGQYDKYEVMDRALGAGLAAAAVRGTDEVLADERLQSSGAVVQVPHSLRTAVPHVRFPIALGGIRVDLRPSPKLGDQTDEVRGRFGSVRVGAVD